MIANGSRFAEALQGAVNRALNEAPRDIPAEHRAEMLQELLDFYRRHQATVDLAVDGLLKLSGPSEGPSQIERLRGSLQKDIAQVDSEAARALLDSAALQPFVGSAQAQGVAAVSVGLSLGLSLVLIGGAAGADVLINTDSNAAYVRGFAAVDVGLDVFAGVGLNVGVWQTLPTLDQKMYGGGLLIDVPVPPAVIRIMAVREGSGGMWASPSDFKLLGFTIAINYGVSTGGVMVYRGPQYALGIPPRRAKLTVCNCTDGTDPCEPGTSSVAQNASSTLACTLENTSGKTIAVPPGSSMNVRMPDFFTASDLSHVQVTPPSGWTSDGWSGNTLTLRYDGSSALDWTGSLKFTLANARPSQASPTAGEIVVSVPDAEVSGATVDKDGIVARANLTLVPTIKYATVSVWTATHPDFALVDGYTDSGTNVSVPSQEDKNKVVTLTEVTDANGKLWYLGCQFYIDDTTQEPYFRACWYEQGTFVKLGVTLFAPNFMLLTSAAQDSVAYYTNVVGNPNTMKITAALSS